MNVVPQQPADARDNGFPFAATLERRAPSRPTEGCWEWRGTKAPNGYGVLYRRFDGRKRTLLAHRITYEIWVGPIPPGLVIDHLCRNRVCIRPEHLEPVTQQVNLLRGEHPNMVAARLNQCRRGHPYTPENTRFTARGTRVCRECRLYLAREKRATRGAVS